MDEKKKESLSQSQKKIIRELDSFLELGTESINSFKRDISNAGTNMQKQFDLCYYNNVQWRVKKFETSDNFKTSETNIQKTLLPDSKIFTHIAKKLAERIQLKSFIPSKKINIEGQSHYNRKEQRYTGNAKSHEDKNAFIKKIHYLYINSLFKLMNVCLEKSLVKKTYELSRETLMPIVNYAQNNGYGTTIKNLLDAGYLKNEEIFSRQILDKNSTFSEKIEYLASRLWENQLFAKNNAIYLSNQHIFYNYLFLGLHAILDNTQSLSKKDYNTLTEKRTHIVGEWGAVFNYSIVDILKEHRYVSLLEKIHDKCKKEEFSFEEKENFNKEIKKVKQNLKEKEKKNNCKYTFIDDTYSCSTPKVTELQTGKIYSLSPEKELGI